MAGQTLHDRLIAARHTLSGQSLARAVCKATTEEIIGPKKKHLDYLIHCTVEPNISVPELCNLLIERTQQSSWVIVFKALITAHHLMCYGNERFIQCMASSSCQFDLENFVDKSSSQGVEMSTFIKRYSHYLNVKASTYRTMGADFCKMKRGKEEGVLRNMSTETLLKTIPILQEQLDKLIYFDCNPDALSNGVMNSCFMLLYRDLIQLFALYNDGVINLFEKFFTMNKKHCREALDAYKKFIVTMDKVSDFLKVAECVGIDKGNIPGLTKVPASLLEEMESHLTFLEGKKSHSTTSAVPSRANSIQNAVSALNTTGTSFTSSITTTDEINGLTIDESMRRAVEEEAAVMNQMKAAVAGVTASERPSKEQKLKEMNRKVPSDVVPPKIPSPLPPPTSHGSTPVLSPPGKTKESNLPPPANKPAATSSLGDLMSINPVLSQPQTFQQVPLSGFPAEGPQSLGFVSDDAFKSAFQNTAPENFDAFGQVLQPQSSMSPPSTSPVPEQNETKSSPTSSKLISNDLDSSLQSLVQNLDINGGKRPKPTGHQWGSPKPSAKTGGTNWIPSAAPITNYGTQMQPMAPAGQYPVAPVVTAPVYAYQPPVPGMVPPQQYMVQGIWASPPPPGYAVMNPGVHNVMLVQQPGPVRMVAQPSPQHMVAEGVPQNVPAGWPASNDPFGTL